MSERNKQEERSLEQKAVIAGVKLDELPEEIREAFANDYVETLRKGKLVYSQDFYKAMVKHVKDDHMTYVEAYKACGFNVVLWQCTRTAACTEYCRRIWMRQFR